MMSSYQRNTLNGPRDLNQWAKRMIDIATGEVDDRESVTDDKNPAAMSLGRLGGLKGGRALVDKLSAEDRAAISRKAAQAR
jgi:hypothetical protein